MSMNLANRSGGNNLHQGDIGTPHERSSQHSPTAIVFDVVWNAKCNKLMRYAPLEQASIALNTEQEPERSQGVGL